MANAQGPDAPAQELDPEIEKDLRRWIMNRGDGPPLGRVLKYTDYDIVQLVRLGLSMLQNGQIESAQVILEGALALDPDNAYGTAVMGFLEATRGNYGLAVELYDRALAAQPDALETKIDRAEALVRLDRVEEAADALKEILEQDPKGSTAAGKRARWLVAQAVRAPGEGEKPAGEA